MSRRNRNLIGQVRSGKRYLTTAGIRVASAVHQVPETKVANAELDSHADTVVAGSTCRILELTEKSCIVYPYSEKYDPIQNVPIAKVATAYDHPVSGETFILIFGQALFMGDTMEHTLICPNQARFNGVIIDDVPKHLSPNQSSTHSIFFPNEGVRIPLQMNGVISCFKTRLPSEREIQNCRWLTVTNDTPWEPSSNQFAEQESFCQEEMQPQVYDRDIYSLSSIIHSNICAINTGSRKLTVPDIEIARIFNCSPAVATKTRLVTTQKGVRSVSKHLTRRYRTKQAALRYDQLGGRHGRFYLDTFFSSIRSTRGNTMGQLFVNDVGFYHFIPMRSKSEAGNALLEFIQDVGIPSSLHTDDAKELTSGKWEQVRKEHGIKQTIAEPYSPFQNRTEVNIRELKKHVRHLMSRTKTPKRSWDFCSRYVSEICCLTAQPLYSLHGRTPYELVTGNTPDISKYIAFHWYQPVYYYDSTVFPEERELLGRWLGVAHSIGQAMCFWILPKSGVPIAQTTLRAVSDAELQSNQVLQELNSFDESIQRKIGDSHLTEDALSFKYGSDELNKALEDVDDGEFEPYEKEADRPEMDDFDEETLDQLLSAEVVLPKGDYQFIGKIVGRKRDANGNPIGRANNNPILDTRVYEVEFPDGTVADYAANILAEALYAQVDADGNRFMLLKEIVDHRKDQTALLGSEALVPNSSGSRNPTRRFSTKGWTLQCMWADGSTSWEPLRNLRESNPLELAQYAEVHDLLNEPAFNWWAKEVLKRSRRIIKKVKTKYWQRTHKYGIRLPKTLREALKLDAENGNTLWYDAIQKEIKNVQVAFQFLDGDQPTPVGYKEIPCHIIFDIKMDFTRKARFVAGGHKTDPPASLTYSSVVSRDSVRIAFLIAALNDLDILAADIGNAYINANVREKVYFIAGDEFGMNKKGKRVVIVKALYGLKTSGAAWRAHLAETLHSMGYTSSLADPDVWFKAECKPDGFAYYSYILVYVDDILAISHKPEATMRILAKTFRLKDGYAPHHDI
jgi:hypothetical protein